MSYIFDASAIFSLISRRHVTPFFDGFTIDLARYEFGNIVWKERHLHKKMTQEEQKELTSIGEGVLQNMDVVNIVGKLHDIIETAGKFNITFYDAAYVFLAKEHDAILVTMDIRLKRKVDNAIHVISPSELV
jgi:predicted nucleic acid-binding protein